MSYSNYEQKIVINGCMLSGVQNIDGNYGINENPLRVAGVGFVDALIEAPLEGNFSMSRDMVSRDPLVETDALGRYAYDEDYISGVILYDDDNKGFGFTKGRVSRYSVSCSAGEIPTIDTDIRVFGELGKHVLSEKIAKVNESFANYPYAGDEVYYTNLNGDVLHQDQDLKSDWNAGTLTASDDQYISLSETSRLIDIRVEDYEAYIDGDANLLAYYNDSSNLWDYDQDGVNEPVQSKTKAEFGESHWTLYGKTEGRTMYYVEKEILGLGKNAFSVESTYANAIFKEHPPIQFSDQSSISIDVDDFSVDAISDFSYSRTINMEPVYAIPKGTRDDWDNGRLATNKNLEPIQVDTQYPIETDINFTMIVDEYEIRQMKDRIQSAPKSNVVINIRDAKTDGFINAFTGQNVRLISESINASIDGEMSISLTYKGYDTYHNPVS